MGFDKHIYQDHCYLDDGTEDKIGLNVEIIADDMDGNSQQFQKLVASNSEFSSHGNYIIIKQDDIQDSDERKVITQTIYPPIAEYCTEDHGTYLIEDDMLVKPGDKFDTHEDFVRYLNDNAKRWYFYYRCTDSHKSMSSYESYTYNCVYLRNKDKYKPKGMRKRNNNFKTDCPCKIKIRQMPNESELTVVYVCNHHDHNLSEQDFSRLQHGRRLPPHIKEEIMDMLALRVDVGKIMKYVQMETGFDMSRPFFYTIERNMKNKNLKRHISEGRFKEILQKISAVDEEYKGEIDESTDDQLILQQTPRRERSSDTLKKHTNMDQITTPIKRRSKGSKASSDGAKRTRPDSSQSSSLEETIQSVKHLQQSVKCETQRNPWILDQCVPVLANRSSGSENKTEFEEPIQINIIETGANDNKVIIESGNYDNEYTIHYYNEDNNEADNNDNESQSDEVADKIAFENDVAQTDASVKQEHHEQSALTEYAEDDSQCDSIYFADKDQDISEFTDSNNAKAEPVDDNTENIQYVNDEGIQYVSEGDHNVVCVYENGEIVQYILDGAIEQGDDNQEMEYNSEDVTEFTDNVQTNSDENSNVRDIGVQTNDKTAKPGHSLMPVFDVFMKKGNVTGFVMNNNSKHVDKEVQTHQDLGKDGTNPTTMDNDGAPLNYIAQVEDTLKKHEYIHKYNIAEYMCRSHFPKYIDTLAKKTRTDVLHMLKNIYREKAMFKMTTTQKGKEGNTMIWYLADSEQVRKQLRRSLNDKLSGGKNLDEVCALKEELKDLKQQNKELIRLIQSQECLDGSSQIETHFE